MGSEKADLDEQIERLRRGDTLLEAEVRALCEKVRKDGPHKTKDTHWHALHWNGYSLWIWSFLVGLHLISLVLHSIR